MQSCFAGCILKNTLLLHSKTCFSAVWAYIQRPMYGYVLHSCLRLLVSGNLNINRSNRVKWSVVWLFQAFRLARKTPVCLDPLGLPVSGLLQTLDNSSDVYEGWVPGRPYLGSWLLPSAQQVGRRPADENILLSLKIFVLNELFWKEKGVYVSFLANRNSEEQQVSCGTAETYSYELRIF